MSPWGCSTATRPYLGYNSRARNRLSPPRNEHAPQLTMNMMYSPLFSFAALHRPVVLSTTRSSKQWWVHNHFIFLIIIILGDFCVKYVIFVYFSHTVQTTVHVHVCKCSKLVREKYLNCQFISEYSLYCSYQWKDKRKNIKLSRERDQKFHKFHY